MTKEGESMICYKECPTINMVLERTAVLAESTDLITTAEGVSVVYRPSSQLSRVPVPRILELNNDAERSSVEGRSYSVRGGSCVICRI